MKFILSFIITLQYSLTATSQDLMGDWQGYYNYNTKSQKSSDTVSIALRFELNRDSTYSIFSYIRQYMIGIGDTIFISKIKFSKKNNLIILQEVNDKENNENFIYQKMFLHYKERKGVKTLTGKWKSNFELKSFSEGEIFFKKVQ